MLNNTSNFDNLTISDGVFRLGASDRLRDLGSVFLEGGRLALGTYNDRVDRFVLQGGTLAGIGTLSARDVVLEEGLVNANIDGEFVAKDGAGLVTLNGRISDRQRSVDQ